MGDSLEASPKRCFEFTPDFSGEDRHELVAKLAHEHWEARGRPLGSPEVDWLAAEKALYGWLVDRGTISQSPYEGLPMQDALYK